jgi:hypothetical protein
VADLDRDAQENADHSPDSKADPVSSAPSASLSAKGVSRRRFAKASAGATGVLLTLHSQPGMACTYCGISPSVAMSAISRKIPVSQLSHKSTTTATCNGRLPDWWADKNNLSKWPSKCDPNAEFRNYFTCHGYSADFAKVKACTLLDGTASCDAGLNMGKYMLAAYLNIKSGRVNFLSIEALQAAWNEWSSKGYYAPMAGQKWYPGDIVGYLYGTMD